jgi:GNAT superfamily N-acetyltransferase
VLPEHQGRGLGKHILDAIDAWLRQNAHPGAFVNLFADRGVAPLYARYGFRARDPDEPGMCYVGNKNDRHLPEPAGPAIVIRTLAVNES